MRKLDRGALELEDFFFCLKASRHEEERLVAGATMACITMKQVHGGTGSYAEGQVLRAIRGPPVLEGDCDVIEEAIARSGNRHQGANDSASVV